MNTIIEITMVLLTCIFLFVCLFLIYENWRLAKGIHAPKPTREKVRKPRRIFGSYQSPQKIKKLIEDLNLQLDRGYSLDVIANRAGISLGMLSKYKAKKARPTKMSYDKIVKALAELKCESPR
jgi:transcriptional regulator with XRE-family HTH domain